MRLGLNLIYLTVGETGGLETYARELIPALLEQRPDLTVLAFVSRDAAAAGGPWSDLSEPVVVPVDPRRRAEWVLAEQLLLPPLAARQRIDVLHSLGSTAPLWGSSRRVVTIHDLIYRVYPEAHFGVRSAAMRFLVPAAARRADRIVAPSGATRDDLVRLLGVPPGKVDVVHQGLGSVRAQPVEEDALRATLELDGRVVVLAVSAKRPHKNLLRLLDALALFPPERRPVLVLPGYATPHEHELRERAARLGLEADTRFLGWIPAEELEGLYRLASCFVFPSLYEGFGLPVLEAMARGVPVACSNRSSLPEIAGDAAILFDPDHPSQIAAAIERILLDRDEAERLRRLGLERVRQFSWAATARGTLTTYDRLFEGSV